MLKKILWLLLLPANVAVIVYFWWHGSSAFLLHGGAETVVALGRIAGLLAAFGILLQLFTMGRMPWLEQAFGLDRLSRFHHWSGIVAIALVIVHPILLAAGYGAMAHVSMLKQFQSFLGSGEMQQATIGALLLIGLVAVSLTIVRRRLRYESWYFVHLLAYAGLFFAFSHQQEIGTDLHASRIFLGYWLLLYTVILGSQIVFRFLRPLVLSARHRFQVTRIVREAHNVISIYIEGRNMNKFSIHEGQFMILRFLRKEMWWQAHPFSLSMVPDGQRLRVTVKDIGDFSSRVGGIPAGTKVIIDGPYGVFTDRPGLLPKTLFIAGGIGITPIRSLLEAMLARGRDCVLLTTNRTRGDIVFASELADLARAFPVRIIHVLTQESSYEGEKGRLDGAKIASLVPDMRERDIFLCGPIPMLDSLVLALKKLGVKAGRLHYEKFEL